MSLRDLTRGAAEPSGWDDRGPIFDEDDFRPPSFVSTPDADEVGGGQRQVVRGSMWFVGSVATGAALSFLYWLIATRLDPQKQVMGAATSLWAQVQLVNYLTGMGLPIAMARYGSGRPRTVHVLFKWALLYTAATSLVGALLFGLIAPVFIESDYLDPLWQWGVPAGLALFFAMITGMAAALLVEVRLVALRQWKWVFGRVVFISLVRLPFLFLPVFHRNAMGILLLVAGPTALSGALGVVGIRSATPPRERGRLQPLPPEARPALRYASVNYLGMIAAQAPQFGLPVVVTALVPRGDYAPFFLAWQITVMVFLIPHTIGQIVLTEGSRNVAAVNRQARLGLKLSGGLMVLATAVVLTASHLGLVTLVFGADYRITGDLLPRLVAAGVPWAVTCVCLAKARVEGDHARTVAITVGFAACTLVPTTILTSRSGVDGTAIAWLLGNTLAAALAVGLTVLRSPRPEGDLVPSVRHAEAA